MQISTSQVFNWDSNDEDKFSKWRRLEIVVSIVTSDKCFKLRVRYLVVSITIVVLVWGLPNILHAFHIEACTSCGCYHNHRVWFVAFQTCHKCSSLVIEILATSYRIIVFALKLAKHYTTVPPLVWGSFNYYHKHRVLFTTC